MHDDTYVHGGCCWRCGLQSNVPRLGRAGCYIPGWPLSPAVYPAHGTRGQPAPVERAESSISPDIKQRRRRYEMVRKFEFLVKVRIIFIFTWSMALMAWLCQWELKSNFIVSYQRYEWNYYETRYTNTDSELNFGCLWRTKPTAEHPLLYPPWRVSALEVLLLSNLFKMSASA